MASSAFLVFSLLCLIASVQCYRERGFNPLDKFLRKDLFKKFQASNEFSVGSSTVYIAPHDGLKEHDKVESLPGQPDGVDFDQYSGYVTVDPNAGRALFYYFAKSSQDAASKPLVLSLNVGAGCSSLGAGAMMELGPFRVNKDGETLYLNPYAWNNEANILFLESPAGVGFSYSNTTSDYKLSGDNRTAIDSYTFLINWLERFPEYKSRDFFITGESYAGHYVPQLAQTILSHNKNSNQTIINLKGIAIGNAAIDDDTTITGSLDFLWSHALISDEIYKGIYFNCNFSAPNLTQTCIDYLNKLNDAVGNIYPYDIYAPLCNSSASASLPISSFDPCSEDYIGSYLNIPQVQTALHANVTSLPYPWTTCTDVIKEWNDSPATLLPTIQDLVESGMLVYIYSGDVDRVMPITATRYAIEKLKTSVSTSWYPWYIHGEVGGYAVGYQKGLNFVSIRGSGHFVPSYQPARALAFFSAFLRGKLPPSS